MSLSPGTRIGPYEIQDAIGAGGMGEVYRARDSRLDRSVAIKILSESLAGDPQLRERFDREARAVAALNHPHICTLHDVGQIASDDASHPPLHFLVMELLDGESLAARLSRGAIPVAQTLEIGAQIAAALDVAHRAGIVHRDIKPGNIFLVRRGAGAPVAKLLDFGLAKAGPPVVSGSASMLPTTPAGVTVQGTILGTLHYMAPEQVEGREADARTDIFAVGCVLHEMVTGARVFDGRSAAGVMAAILERDAPALRALQPGVSAQFSHVVERCLAKDPDERWQSAADVMRELRWAAGAEPAPQAAVAVAAGSSRRPWLMMAASAVVGFVVGAGALALYTRSAALPEARVTRLSIMPPQSASLTGDLPGISVSRDGRTVLYGAADQQGVRQLYAHNLDSLEPAPLRGTEGALQGTLSPDGKWALYVIRDEIRKLALAGGPAVKICAVPPGGVYGLDWGADGSILFGSDQGIQRVSESGGMPALVVETDRGAKEQGLRFPVRDAGGDTVLYTAWFGSNSNARVAAASLSSGRRATLLQGFFPRAVPGGRLAFSREVSVWIVAFDARNLTVQGEPVPVLDRVQSNLSGRAGLDVGSDGTLVYQVRGESRNRLSWFSPDGRAVPATDEQLRGVYHPSPRLSPNGNVLAVTVHPTGERDKVVMYDLERGVREPLAPAWRDDSRFPVWSPDGRRIAFSSTSGGSWDIYEVSASGGDVRPLLVRPGDQRPADWTPDGTTLVFEEFSGGDPDIWVLPRSGVPSPLIAGKGFTETESSLSPDGKSISFSSDESSRPEVYVQPFPGPGERRRISTNGGREPVWRRDGRELFYRENDSTLVAVGTAGEGAGRTFDRPRRLAVPSLADDRGSNYDVTPDGRRFIAIESLANQRASIVVVQNWLAEVAGLRIER
jgi:eukaryotic-like serine/threonine-protein kinase